MKINDNCLSKNCIKNYRGSKKQITVFLWGVNQKAYDLNHELNNCNVQL